MGDHLMKKLERHLQDKGYPSHDINFYIDPRRHRINRVSFFGNIPYLEELMDRIIKDGMDIELYDELMERNCIGARIYVGEGSELYNDMDVAVTHASGDIEITSRDLKEGLWAAERDIHTLLRDIRERVLEDMELVSKQLEDIGNNILEKRVIRSPREVGTHEEANKQSRP